LPEKFLSLLPTWLAVALRMLRLLRLCLNLRLHLLVMVMRLVLKLVQVLRFPWSVLLLVR